MYMGAVVMRTTEIGTLVVRFTVHRCVRAYLCVCTRERESVWDHFSILYTMKSYENEDEVCCLYSL